MPPSNLPPANESPAIELPAPDPRWADWSDGPSPGPRRTRVLIGVLIGAVVLALLVTAGVVAFRVARDPARLTRGAATPQAAVQGFLDAVANDHADRALSFEAAAVPHNRTFLTDAVLARAHRQDPITAIVVGAGPADDDETTAQIDAHYQVGSRAATTTFALHKGSGRTGWTIDQTTILLDPSALLKDRIPLLLAGVAASGTSIELFPGSYRASTGLSRLDWGADPRLTVVDFDPLTSVRTTLSPRITDDGRTDVAAAVTKASNACLTEHDARPGCGLDPNHAGYTFKKGTIRWRYDDQNPPWPTTDVELDPSRPSSATTTTEVYADLYATCSTTPRTRDCRKEGFGASFGTPSVDLTEKTLQVSWS